MKTTTSKKKLNIAIVCFPTLGGSGAVATDLGVELANRGHYVHFIAHDVLFKLNGEYHKNITFHKVENVDHPLFEDASIYVLSLANKIAEVSRRYNIDIINTHYATPHAVAAILAKQMPGTKAKVINTFHGTDVSSLSKNLNIKEVVRHAVKNCDGLTAVASALAADAKKNFLLEKQHPIKVIYNWVKPNTYPAKQAQELRELFAPNGEKIITHISNFREVKRVEDVIEVYRGIDKQVKAKLLLIGDGPEQRLAHRLISKYKLMNKVHVLGVQLNVSRILSISDLFLLPSKNEAFSLAALEAMSFGVPVIATKVGGMPEMITDYQTGFISKVGDVKDMAKKGIDILTNEKLYNKVRENILQKIAENYIPEKIISQYEDYYYEILAKN